MPKALSTPGPAAARPALRRNQACHVCRKRKLKCDAVRPHCTNCVKQWQSSISVPPPPGLAHFPEPQCVYDPVDGLTLAPDTDPTRRIQMLEGEVSRLKIQLQEKNNAISPVHYNQAFYRSGSASSASTSSGATWNKPSLCSIKNASTLPLRPTSQSPDPYGEISQFCADSVLDLIHSGWNPDLPEPHILDHYIDVFFRCDPCGSRILHRPSFLSAMRLPPQDPAFPHSAILHAMCASASRWSSRNLAILRDGSRRDEFAEYHASKARQYIDKTMVTGEDIFQVVQACILLSWYLYQEGRWIEIWIIAGFQTRVAIPLRLNYPGTSCVHDSGFPGGYLLPPNGPHDRETRRRTWWMAVIFDRIVSIGGWVHAIDERDIGTELPWRGEDFEGEQGIPDNPQDMNTEDLFTSHLPKYTDSFLLLIKAIMMFGRVTDFNVRGNLRAPATPSKHQNPFALQGFDELDNLVHHRFLESLHYPYRCNSGVTDVSSSALCFDTDLYMVHILPHAATITLHFPYMDLNDEHRISTNRCIKAAQEILVAFFRLSATSLDLTRLHPLVTICWYLAAVIQLQVFRHCMEIGDHVKQADSWGNIDVLRQAMLSYGTRSPIGIRQEKLLQALMKEIVRVPLYPFSHATLFAEPTVPSDGAPNAPLPNHSSSSDSDGLLYSSEFEVHSGSAASTFLSPLYHIASNALDEVPTGNGHGSSG